MTHVARSQVNEIVSALLHEDRQYAVKERRGTARSPFFRPVMIYLGRENAEPLRAFSRDLSTGGIGLVHPYQLEPSRIGNLVIYRLWDEPAILHCELLWCERWGQGWYISGWSFRSYEND